MAQPSRVDGSLCLTVFVGLMPLYSARRTRKNIVPCNGPLPPSLRQVFDNSAHECGLGRLRRSFRVLSLLQVQDAFLPLHHHLSSYSSS
ncbi:hypothetical protein NEOLEDRAFT_884962 [Neolentinus lepideus HHB14362 ss-1]|uniref:Uncharacterized protein n=1 Tax=Neolentinus lepideus HHB14362 ss-1 TaxID=1314782 RepID=A0A165NW67_9AGAM|nr:hypothetical protein NEOLEDRAFT_884962 [Neolentinus lepideus HHB14362 ss-1]